jgi:hypothetical protein
MLDSDTALQTAGAKMLRKFLHPSPLAHYTEKDPVPTLQEVGDDAEVEEW